MIDKLEWANADHSVWVYKECDWGGPCEYTPMCRCGWRGNTVGDILHSDGSGELGTEWSAFADALDHVDMTVLDWIREREDAIAHILNLAKLYIDAANKTRSLIDNMRHLS